MSEAHISPDQQNTEILNREYVPESGLRHTSRIIGNLTLSRTVEFEYLSQAELQDYLENRIYPVVTEVLHIKNSTRSAPVSAQTVQNRAYNRYADIFDFAMGYSLEDISANHDPIRKPKSVEVGIRETIRLIRKSELLGSNEAILEDFLADNPSAVLKKRTAAQNTNKPESNAEADIDEPADEKDSVGRYLDDMSKTRLLTAEEEVELSKRIEAGLYAAKLLERGGRLPARREELEWLAEDGAEAKELFIKSNLRLAFMQARKFRNNNVSPEDLVQESNLGLIRAVEKFDYTKGFKFSTYATWWLKQSIGRGVMRQERAIRLPVNLSTEVDKIRRVSNQLADMLGRDPEPEEVAEKAGVTTERLADLKRWNWRTVSLNAPVGEKGDSTLEDLIASETAEDPVETAAHAGIVSTIRALIENLSEREADIIRHRFGIQGAESLTLLEIGEKHGISGERIRQIEKSALATMRTLLDKDVL